MKLEGSVNGEDIKVLDSQEGFVPTLAQFTGQEPPAAPVATTVTYDPPAAPVTTGANTATVTMDPPATSTPALPDGQYGSFRDVDTMYKSWREASKKISQDGEEKKRLREENERLQAALRQPQVSSPAPMPTLSKEQMLEQFVNDPLSYQQQLKQQIAQEYLAPVVQTLQQMYREQQELREQESISPNDRNLYQQFKQDGMFDAMRQSPRYARYTNAELLELGKAQMIQHQVSELQAQIEKAKQGQVTKNARAVVESGGTTTVPSKTFEQMSEDELKSLARVGWNTGERF